jgi:hypothetical protein
MTPSSAPRPSRFDANLPPQPGVGGATLAPTGMIRGNAHSAQGAPIARAEAAAIRDTTPVLPVLPIRPSSHGQDPQAPSDDLPGPSTDVSHVTTQAERAGLRVEDIARPPLKMRTRLYRLDAQVGAALKQGKARWAKKTRRAKTKKSSA